MIDILPVILSGGAGSRLWPLSRTAHPKQFLSLYSDQSLFQETVLRLGALSLSDPLIICNESHRFLVAQHLQQITIKPFQILLEPMGRNTAPAIAVAALAALERYDDPILIVLPADHMIEDQEAFAAAVKQACAMAQNGYLVTFGIKPTMAHTGYGYIESGMALGEGAFAIKGFKEKPNLETAQVFFQTPGFFWNSGMFVFRASAYLKELENNEPAMIEDAKTALSKAHKDPDFTRLDAQAFGQCKDISIDYAVMEKTTSGAVVMLDAQWCDVGSWHALWDVLPKDVDGNVMRGDVLCENTHGSYINAGSRLVCTLGVDDLVIVDSPDALLVARRSDSEKIKTIVDRLKKEDRKSCL